MALRVLKQSVDGQTGYITAVVRVETTRQDGTTVHGPDETVIIAPIALRRRFHDPACQPATRKSLAAAVQAWLAAHHTAAALRLEHTEHVRTAITDLTGRLLEFPEPDSVIAPPDPDPALTPAEDPA